MMEDLRKETPYRTFIFNVVIHNMAFGTQDSLYLIYNYLFGSGVQPSG